MFKLINSFNLAGRSRKSKRSPNKVSEDIDPEELLEPMKKKVRVLRRKPSPCDEAEINRPEFQQKSPEKVIQEVKSEPTDEETQENQDPENLITNMELLDDLPPASELDDVPTDLKVKAELTEEFQEIPEILTANMEPMDDFPINFNIKNEPELNIDEDFPAGLPGDNSDETGLEFLIEVKKE
jgi:hypothetical protein